ncbi:MAG: UDP-N-acetylglucosamine 2-epimerase [Candidatus Jorgensenbacteria bacterium GW2011_GWA1_48_11]|uniref:UDP-N-acetylglucosamine 2-epimerase (non-hydrolyzing) n=1 Tax=Candidatus Jorgensenbacteria bacterium GW2011_GWA1_48_11 TaxID=1618660 RepID=A0A0G1WMA4_9BACT|nr:MAG: UDP-N-acetylglucosamine 2-epimerase [Candidatus Jorgensenbacteria bacterium GW2011_GWA1_48_11]KKW11961.1 MAG: UDP-N-acetylglucosamine 2-epimerase [Candidatus Jorgensenbacteria bacterium GW2011_GWB1_49_9]
MKKILVVFGTRPEAIKLAPVIKEMKKNKDFKVLVCVFRQHKEMLDQVLKTFDIRPDFDLGISVNDKELLNEKVNVLIKIKTLIQSGFGFLRFFNILRREKPDLLMVEGDTSTVFLAGFLAYYFKIKVAHVEAGLRTYDKYSPFPEEMNRQLLCRLADFNFAPTETARQNLLNEGVPDGKIYVTGNTAIDALLWMNQKQKNHDFEKGRREDFMGKYGFDINAGKKIILVTAHRRESFGEGLKNICAALKELAEKRNDIMIIYPVHLNPSVQNVVYPALKDQKNIFLTEPLDYESNIFLMSRSYLIMTDSGGIQEEAPSLNKPVLVMREKTERVEGVEAGVSRLVGTDKSKIVNSAVELLDNSMIYESMIGRTNPYGDGKAAERIISALRV